jgi:hypothetical protein
MLGALAGGDEQRRGLAVGIGRVPRAGLARHRSAWAAKPASRAVYEHMHRRNAASLRC